MEADPITAIIGNIVLGPGHPVLIQSMCNTPTLDTDACVDQCIRIFDAGGGLSRLAARNIGEARNLHLIRKKLKRKGYLQPLCADVHFNPAIAMEAATAVEKVRINPGNFAGGDYETPFLELLKVCRDHGTALRIGVNHGSLSQDILEKYGDTPEGMVESALRYLRICRRENFTNVVVSLKSSNTRIMVYSNRLMRRRMKQENIEPPLHLGVTEAGEGEEGRIRSAAGIGTLLNEGAGNTIRVSLTEEPENEIPVARKLLEATEGNRKESQDDSATEYRRRISEKYGILGGGQVPVVIEEIPQMEDSGSFRPDKTTGSEPDFYFVPNHRFPESFSPHGRYILTAETWMQDEYPQDRFFPLFDLPGFQSTGRVSELINFLIVRPEEVSQAMRLVDERQLPCCLVFMHDEQPASREAFLRAARNPGFRFPIMVYSAYRDKDAERFQIRAASGLACYFIDGYADGIWLDNPFAVPSLSLSTSFKILQASRARITETEFIACPSCGRTLFNIQDTLAKVKEATSHLRHLKIAVMGCIVNGPGEMADADYGYVGSGKGKVNLYRNREPMKKNIREEDAVKELVLLIKENGDWID